MAMAIEMIPAAEPKKTDRRVIKTKRAICNAFAELLSTKSINEITVTDIAEAADINRKTVYNYYSGIHEILDEIENKLVASYEKLIQDLDFKNGLESPYKIFDSLTSLISMNLDFYGSLLKINANSQLVVKIVTALEARLKQAFLEQQFFPEEKLDLIVSYIVSGMLAAYQNWFNSGREQPIKEFSKDVSEMVLSGVQAFTKK